MPPNESRIRVKKVENVTQVEFLDRNILDEANISAIRQELEQLVDGQSKPRVLINFQGVEHLSSAALGALIAIHQRIAGREGQFRLANIDPQIYEVFMITRLNKMLSIHNTVDDAMKHFSS